MIINALRRRFSELADNASMPLGTARPIMDKPYAIEIICIPLRIPEFSRKLKSLLMELQRLPW
jgi:hypothetical protein